MAALENLWGLLWVVSRHSVNRQRSFLVAAPRPATNARCGQPRQDPLAAASCRSNHGPGRRRIAKCTVDRLLTTDAAAATANPTSRYLMASSARAALVLSTRFFIDKSPSRPGLGLRFRPHHRRSEREGLHGGRRVHARSLGDRRGRCHPLGARGRGARPPCV